MNDDVGPAGYGGAAGGGAASPPPPPPPQQLDDNGAAAAAAAAADNADNSNAANNNTAGGVSSTGLIRLTLRKPMGIVFEPMTDPHNASQQRGVRICDLPRTGAAALSGKLQVGDELLSINDKTMSRLTFDEIMDFIIEADPEAVSLLFRRPRKENLAAAMGVGLGGAGVVVGVGAGAAGGAAGDLDAGFAAANANNNDTTKVKWIDDDHQKASADAAAGGGGGGEAGDKKSSSSSSRRNRNSRDSRENRHNSNHHHHVDDDTVGSGGTFETRETMETMETRERKKGRGGGKSSSRRGGGGRGSSRRKDYEKFGESFLDMLIDSLCAPLVTGDGKKGKRGGHGLHRSDTDGDSFYTDDEDDYTYDDRTYDSRGTYDDDTFVTYESGSVTEMTAAKESSSARRRKNDHRDSRGRDQERRGGGGRDRSGSQPTIDEQDEEGLDTKPSRGGESKSSRKSKLASKLASNSATSPTAQPYEDDATLETVDTAERAANMAAATAAASGAVGVDAGAGGAGGAFGAAPGGAMGSTPLGLAPINESNNFGGAGAGAGAGFGAGGDPFMQRHTTDPVGDPDLNVGAPPGAAGTSNLPISELEYDDQFDHGADVSVMESLGGPSLLIENQQRREMAAAAQPQPLPVPAPTKAVSNDLIAAYAADYSGGEVDIVADPDRFYRFVVQGLLERNEPEKVRLLDKLLAKYDGREEHLITKLSVRYEKNAEADAAAAGVTAETVPAAPAQFETFGTNTFTGTTAAAGAGNADGDAWGAPAPSSGGAQAQSPQNNKAAGPDQDAVSDVSGSKDHESYSSGSQYSGSSIDGTSPAVIAQVSELLNYVYGKTSVPGQIDRVSTIMRAYEGREAVLLELLETKALIKANAEGDAAMTDLPASLRDSPALAANQRSPNAADESTSFEKKPSSSPSGSPVSGLTATSPTNAGDRNLHDSNAARRPSSPVDVDDSPAEGPDDEEMGTSAISDAADDDESAAFQDFSPAPTSGQLAVSDGAGMKESSPSPVKTTAAAAAAPTSGASAKKKQSKAAAAAAPVSASDATPTKKKKKGIFKKVFGSSKKNSKKNSTSGGAASSSSSKKGGKGMLSPKGGKNAGLLRVDSHEGSI